MANEIVNLRANGTDKANPTAGTLVGTAEIPEKWISGQRYPNDEEFLVPLLSVDGRLFRYAHGSFGGFGPDITPEYIEVAPIAAENFKPA
jgi:hypothetical protein